MSFFLKYIETFQVYNTTTLVESRATNREVVKPILADVVVVIE